jgi:hypothetical protein
MKRMTIGCVLAALAITALARPAAAQDLQQKLAAVKQSVAANQQALRTYTWLQKPEEPATLRVIMQSMSNGISFPGSIVLSIPASKLDVRITKSNYQQLAQ